MPSLRVSGISFNVELPYSAGHICTESEAAELNRLRVERIQTAARKMISNGGLSPFTLELMAVNFKFTIPPYSLPPDPFELECLKIAKSIAQERKGRDSFSWSEKAIAALAKSPMIREEAQRRISANEAAAAKLIDMEFSI